MKTQEQVFFFREHFIFRSSSSHYVHRNWLVTAGERCSATRVKLECMGVFCIYVKPLVKHWYENRERRRLTLKYGRR